METAAPVAVDGAAG